MWDSSELLLLLLLIDSSKDFKGLEGNKTSIKRFFSEINDDKASFLLDLMH